MIALTQNDERSMNTPIRQSRIALAMGSFVLWIDSVGGFRLLEGDQFTIGGLGGDEPADIAVRSAWRTRMATLTRSGDDFWLKPIVSQASDAELRSRPVIAGEVLTLEFEKTNPNSSEPRLRLHKPSPLSRTAVLTLDPPHRFVAPVDGILLVDKMILIGADRSSHIRASRLVEALIMIKRGADWTIRQKDAPSRIMVEGERIEIGELVMTLRREPLVNGAGEKK